jgi:uncharacterized membrane protein affecting hemolysin expression
VTLSTRIVQKEKQRWANPANLGLLALLILLTLLILLILLLGGGG